MLSLKDEPSSLQPPGLISAVPVPPPPYHESFVSGKVSFHIPRSQPLDDVGVGEGVAGVGVGVGVGELVPPE